MKKRVLSLALALVIMVGVVPTAGTCLALSDKPTDTTSSSDKRGSTLSRWVIYCYRNAMALYDLEVNTSRGTATTDYIFLDPHEAWDSYIARKYSNNWFTWWVNQMDLHNEELTRPNNLHPEDPEWWAKMDSYLENVAPKEHIVDKTIDLSDFYPVTSFETGVASLYLPRDLYSDERSKLSAEDEMWIEWYDVTQDYPQRSAFSQFRDMSFQDWLEMRNTMSDEESNLFHAWWQHASDNAEDETTFEEYKEREGYTENQPVQPSPAPVPTATPAPTKNPDVVVPDGVTEITGGTCHLHDYHPYTNPLNSVTIPTSVTKIYHHAFVMCHPKDIYYAGTKEQWDAIEMVYVMDEINMLEGTTIHFSDGSTSTPTPTPSAAPTATPEPTPTVTPAPVETQPVQHFADVAPDAWYYEAVNNMAEAGILKGKGDGLFHPNDNITNGEVATIICRIGQSASERYVAFGDPNSKYYSPDAINNMTHWAERAIAASVASTNGTGAGTFYASVETADNACSRRSVFEAMAMLAYEDQFPQYWHPEYLYDGQVQADGRIYYVKKLDVTYEEQMAAKSEIHDIRDTDFGTMTCWVLGIIHGDGNGYVHPDAGITRAELCQILYNMGAKTCYLDL